MSSARLSGTRCCAVAALALVLPPAGSAQDGSGGYLTIGPAAESRWCDGTQTCATGRRLAAGLCGVVTDAAGHDWAVPAQPAEGRHCANVYDDCNGPGVIDDYRLDAVIVDEDGVEVTGFIQADNYFELYVNGEYICKDPTAFIPFTANAVRFRARYPITYALRLVDWEEHLGVGLEYARYNVGDGGVVARFSDGTETNDEWRCQVFYVAPLDDEACVDTDTEGRRTTAMCPGRPQCADEDPNACRALHFEIPADWASPGFDDSSWPAAKIWGEGVVSPPAAFRELREHFGGARFIWTDSLRLDNHVLCRMSVQAPQ